MPRAGLHRDAGRVVDARWLLRDGTRDLHDRAEAALGDGPMRDLGEYIGMLRTMLDMTETVLRAIDTCLPAQLTVGLEQDRARLRSDISDLGASVLPRASGIVIGSRAEALGALYVCEGSKLGARILARQAETGLGLTAEHGAAYLNAEGTASGARWQAFVATMNRDIVHPDDVHQALLAARSVFRIIVDRYKEA